MLSLSKIKLLEKDKRPGKNLLHEEVGCVCLTIGFMFCSLRSLGQLGSSWVWWLSFALPIDLHKSIGNSEIGFYKHSILKDTKIRVKLPRTPRKQSTISINSNSNSAYPFCWILFVNTDPPVCIVLVFWKEVKKVFFFVFFLQEPFLSQCWTFCLLFCVGSWNELP